MMRSGRTDYEPPNHRLARRQSIALRTAGAVVALLVIMVVPPGAQTRNVPAARTAANADPEQVDLLVGRSTVIRMERPITRVSLSTPEVADALVTTPYEVLIHGKSPGTISLLIWGDTGSIRSYDVNVKRDLGVLEEQIRQLFPGEPIVVASNGSDVVLSGTVSSKYVVDKASSVAVGYVEKPENVVNLLQQQPGVATNQILLRVRFAEVSRTALQELGAAFFTGLFGYENWIARLTTQQFPAPDFDNEKGLVFSDLLNLLAFNTQEQLGAVVKALQVRGLFQSLAEPNLITQDGVEASFLAGGEYPYPVLQGAGVAGAVTILFKEFGIRLRFTPTVVGQDLIQLKVAPEVSALDFSNAIVLEGFRVPALTTRRTETQVELRDGQTFAIAGLLDNTVTETMSKVPGIGDIPILGYLFRSRAYQKNRTELVVMITPHVVRRDSSGVTPTLPNLVQPFLEPATRTIMPPPPPYVPPQAANAPTGHPSAAATLGTPAGTPAGQGRNVTAEQTAGGAQTPVLSSAPAARPAPPVAVKAPETPDPALRSLAEAAPIRVEGPALSPVEGPVASRVERPAVSSVERPVVSPVERPVTEAERRTIERARKEEEERARAAAELDAKRQEALRKLEEDRAREVAKVEGKRLEEERRQAEKAREEEQQRARDTAQLAAAAEREAEARARAQAEVDRKRWQAEQRQAERTRKEQEQLARAQAERAAEEAARTAKAEQARLASERKEAEERRKGEEKLARAQAGRAAEEAERAAEVEEARLEEEQKQAEEQRKAAAKLERERAKREAEIEKILAEYRKALAKVQRKLGTSQGADPRLSPTAETAPVR